MLIERWIRTGFVAGILTVAVYPLLIAVQMPLFLTLLLVAAFGSLFIIASIGLYHFISLERRTVSLQIGVIFNILAVALLILNLATFPTPPAEAGLFDLGPLLGVWYLFVTVRIGLSLNWVKQKVHKKIG